VAHERALPAAAVAHDHEDLAAGDGEADPLLDDALPVAHRQVADLDLRRLSREDLHAFHPAFRQPASELLDLERSVEARSLPGGTARVRVAEALNAAEAEVSVALARLEAEGGIS
jgi:CRP-like cAMP-binding protein